ncbi:DUF7020 family protein [Rossellomorea marisflavi]|uniref:DUF7020 family protein n=1 Tax=Rossellomorea marisflavi TaxID=189381 RepID=UPI003FA09950
MNTTDWLRKFAKEQEISTDSVEGFIKKNFVVKTLNDILNSPRDLLKNHDFITDVPEPLSTYIMENHYHGERYKTQDVEYVIERIGEEFDDIEFTSPTAPNKDILDLTVDEIKSLEADKSDDEGALNQWKELAICIIEEKFGSAVLDW